MSTHTASPGNVEAVLVGLCEGGSGQVFTHVH